jgi:spermidine synthase
MTLLATAQYHRFEGTAEILKSVSYWNALLRGPTILHRERALTRVLSVEDGIGGFVAVKETVNALGQTNRVLSVSGKTDASSMSDMCTEALSGHIPMLLHPHATNALVIGLASGITVGEMLHYPLARLDALEISPEVFRACRAFTPWNHGALSDSRTRVILQDARTHLTLSTERYDVIVSEPSNPWMAGVANLFTRDYFTKVRDHLKPGGIFVQWFHTYQSDWETFAIFGRTLGSVFPNSILMRTSASYGDCLFVCFESASGSLDLDTVAKNLPHAARSSNVRIRTAEILSNLVVDENLRARFGPGPSHTDAHPILEYLAPSHLYAETTDAIGRILRSGGTFAARTIPARKAFEAVDRQIEYAEFLSAMFRPPFGFVKLDQTTPAQKERHARCLAEFAGKVELGIPEMLRIPDERERSLFLEAQARAIAARLELLRAAADDRNLAQAYLALGNIHVVRRKYDQAETSYKQVLEYEPELRPALQNLQVMYERTGRYKEAAAIVTRILEIGPVTPRLLAELAANTVKMGDERHAIELLDRALALDAKYAPALIVASTIYGNRNDLPRALDYSRRAVEADPNDARGHANLAVALYKLGKEGEAREVVARGLNFVPNDPRLLEVRRQIQ